MIAISSVLAFGISTIRTAWKLDRGFRQSLPHTQILQLKPLRAANRPKFLPSKAIKPASKP